jgi:N-acetylneuraminic acid mutarotase
VKSPEEGLNAPRTFDAEQQGWSPTGSLGTARSLHTATSLANGKVLVVGGINVINPCCTDTDSAELYDPATGQWSATGNPSAPRSNHIAVRLANGKVLIAGGNGDPFSNVLNSVEIYNPDTGTWSPAANLNVARQSPRAALLADGRVLVTGGLVVTGTTAGFTNTAEVYDPAANVWSPTGTMNSGRVLHTVTLLPNGKVLAAGGSAASFSPIQAGTAEIYDPTSNTWTLTGEMTTPRQAHTTTLLADGKVLVTGGAIANGNIINDAELYDPASGQWTAISRMSTPRALHTLTALPNGKVLAVGGSSANNGGLLKSSELYDPAAGDWTAAGELSAGRNNHTATLLWNGKVLAIAGSGGGQLTSAELFNSGIAALANVSAASFAFTALAPESIVAAFGADLAAGTQTASGLSLPTTLAGVSVRVRDRLGVERLAPLFFVSPNQINYKMPPGTADGEATVTVMDGDRIVAGGSAVIANAGTDQYASLGYRL